MLDKYTNELELLLIWYERAKEVVIKAESMDSLNKSYIQPMHEQRYCLDHFVRAIVYEQTGESDEEVKKSIVSAVGHLQRAYSDSIEWMLISVKDEYKKVLKRYSPEQINMVFPEYYAEVRPALEEITEIVDQYKVNKSVEQATKIDILADDEITTLNVITDQFLEGDIASKLEEYLKCLYQREQPLIEIKRKNQREAIWSKLIWPIITAIVAGVIVAWLMG